MIVFLYAICSCLCANLPAWSMTRESTTLRVECSDIVKIFDFAIMSRISDIQSLSGADLSAGETFNQ